MRKVNGKCFGKKSFRKVEREKICSGKVFMRKSFWLKVFREKFSLGKNICGKVPEKVLEKKVSAPEKNLSGKSFSAEKFLGKGKNEFESRKLKRRNVFFFGKEQTNTRETAGQLYIKIRMLARNTPPGIKKIRIFRNKRPKKRNEYPKNNQFPAKNGHF